MAAGRLCARPSQFGDRSRKRATPDASFNLAQAYRLGRGVPINLAAAKIWFERAANKGHIDAQATLGLMLFENGDRAAGAANG